MPKSLSHEDIAQRFVDAKVIDFNAMGKLISEFGPALALNNDGWYGINVGRFNTLACMLRADDVERLVGDLRSAALTAKVLGGAVGKTRSE